MADLPPDLSSLPRKELVALAKSHGVKANQKSDVIIAELKELSEFHDSEESYEDGDGNVDQVKDLEGMPPPLPKQTEKEHAELQAGATDVKDGMISGNPSGTSCATAASPGKNNDKKQPRATCSNNSPSAKKSPSPIKKTSHSSTKEPKAAFGHGLTETKSRIQPATDTTKIKPFKANTRKQKDLPLSPRNKAQMERYREQRARAREQAQKGGVTHRGAFGHGVDKTESRVPLGNSSETNGGGDGKEGMVRDDDSASFASATSSVSSGQRGHRTKTKKQVPAWKVASRDFRRIHKPAPQDATTGTSSGGPKTAQSKAAFGHGVDGTKSRVQAAERKEEVKPFRANTKKLKPMDLSERNRKQMEKFRARQEAGRVERAKKAVPAEFTRS
mmetsp:Transcript_5760/g.10901  ORF Transcript_5760/g.10901 Transcript_5760/m.10901 type:complete len:388 (-) Transcript_5760:202-1365(-)